MCCALGNLLVDIREPFEKLSALRLHRIHQTRRNLRARSGQDRRCGRSSFATACAPTHLAYFDLLALLAEETKGFSLDDIDQPLVRATEANRDLQRRRIQAELGAQRIDHCVRVRALAVQLVDEGEPRDSVPPAMTPKTR